MENIDFEKIKKISIIGGPGSGKTTLSDNLGKELDLPVIHIDGIHHLKDWKTRDKAERDAIILKKLEEEKWVMDGTYRDTLEIRIQKSDLTIFLDYSSAAMIKGVLSRYFKHKGLEKPEIPGCKEQMTLHFLLYTAKWHRKKGKFVKEVINRNNDKKTIIFKNRNELNIWYKKQFNKEINVK